ncbi:peptide MFS transporter [Acetobacteraceae bacterium]|nr:peptide MFS transporter [Acetobacteraceae bacterium]
MTELIPEDPSPIATTDQLSSHLQKALWGQPFGLWIASLTEFWIAAATYGMQSILILYIQEVFLDPNTIGSVYGGNFLLWLSNALYHPPSLIGVGMSGAIMALYLAIIYAMPLLGAFLADYLLGRNLTIILGIALSSLGLALLAIPSLFVVSILIFLVGVGFVGSLKAQVGSLYSETDRRRSDAYQIYSIGIQVAVMFYPLITGRIALTSWKCAFILCAASMLLACITYVKGQKYFPPSPPISWTKLSKNSKVKMTVLEKKHITLILFITLLFAVCSLPNMELNDGYLIWAKEAYAPIQIFWYKFQVSDLYSLDGFISTVTAVIVLWFWQFYDKHNKPVGDMGKILIGTFIACLGPLILAYASFKYPNPHQVSLWWGVLFHTINDFGFAMSTMIGLSLVSRLAPAKITTIMISVFWLHICLCNILVGKLASLIETIDASTFWLLHSGFSFIGLLGLIFIAIYCKNLLPQEKNL